MRQANWRRGVYRLWIGLSVVWSAFVIFSDIWECLNDPNWQPPMSDWIAVPAIAGAPWVLIGIIIGTGWIVRGFRIAAD